MTGIMKEGFREMRNVRGGKTMVVCYHTGQIILNNIISESNLTIFVGQNLYNPQNVTADKTLELSNQNKHLPLVTNYLLGHVF